MSSIAIKPYASIKGNSEYVGAIVTFAVKTAASKVPGTDFGVSWAGTDLTLSSTISHSNFYVDFANNIPFKNNENCQHATPIFVDRTGGVYNSASTDKGLTNSTANYIFANTTGNTVVMTPTTNITIADQTPNVSGYKMSSSATIYSGVWTTTTFTAKNFFANPSGLNSTTLNYNLASGSGNAVTASSYASNDRFKSEDATTLGDYTLYSVILPPVAAEDTTSELKFEDGSNCNLNDSDVHFRLLSCVLQSIKITCAAPTLHTGESAPADGQYINNNSSTLVCFATRYIQYNTQETSYGDNKISIEPGNKTVVLPGRALWNTGGVSAGQAYTNGYLSGTSATGSVVLHGSTISTLKSKIEGSNDVIPYHTSGTANIATYTLNGQTYWYATTIYKSSGVKNLKDAAILTTNSTMTGQFSNSNVINGGVYGTDTVCLTINGSTTSQTFRSPVDIIYAQGLEGTIPNISGWINEAIYLFPTQS